MTTKMTESYILIRLPATRIFFKIIELNLFNFPICVQKIT